MEYIAFIVILSLLVGYVMHKVYSLVSRVKGDKKYIDAYQAVYSQKEGSFEQVSEYVKDEKDPIYRNKGYILKLCSELDNHLDYEDTLKEMDLRAIFTRNNRFSKERFLQNSDTYLCLYLAMAKARKASCFDVLNVLCEKINLLPESENTVEYQLAKAIYNSLCEKEDRGFQFLTDLLEGNYTQYTYDKKLIGLYKRFAAATLAYNGELVDEWYPEDLRAFANTGLGVNYMKSLDIYDRFETKEEE